MGTVDMCHLFERPCGLHPHLCIGLKFMNLLQATECMTQRSGDRRGGESPGLRSCEILLTITADIQALVCSCWINLCVELKTLQAVERCISNRKKRKIAPRLLHQSWERGHQLERREVNAKKER